MSQNSINTGYLASTSSTVIGANQRELITPFALESKDNIERRLGHGETSNLAIETSATQIFMGAASSLVAPTTTNPVYVNAWALGELRNFKFIGVNTLNFSLMLNSTFGTTPGVAWASPMPMYVYMCLRNDTGASPVFGLSRLPHLSQTPANTLGALGGPLHPPVTNSRGMYLFQNVSQSVTLANYAGGVCVRIGVATATKNASDQWTLTSSFTGNNVPPVEYTFPLGQMGASVGKYFDNNGGVAPTYGSGQITYVWSMDGLLTVRINLSTLTGPSPSGAVNAILSLPFLARGLASGVTGGDVRLQYAANVARLSVGITDVQLYMYDPPPGATPAFSTATYASSFAGASNFSGQIIFYVDGNLS